MSSHDGDEVGYRKPPKKTQFKKGQSGNPRGRPKGSGVRSSVEKVLAQTVPITIDGVRRRVPITEAMTMQLAQRALGGDATATRDFLKIASQVTEARREVDAKQPLEVIITDFDDVDGCKEALEALGVIAEVEADRPLRIQAWVIEAALARGAELTDAQRKLVKEFTIRPADALVVPWRPPGAG